MNFSTLLRPPDALVAQRMAEVPVSASLFTLLLAFILYLCQITLFSVFRTKIPKVYEPRTQCIPLRLRVKSCGKGTLDWIKVVYSTVLESSISSHGLDGYFFLRYLRLLTRMFWLSFISIGSILIPLNLMGTQNRSGINRLSWANVDPSELSLIPHIVMLTLFVVSICWAINHEIFLFISIRSRVLIGTNNHMKASARTLLIRNIPEMYNSPEQVKQLFSTFPHVNASAIWRVCDYRPMKCLLDRRTKLIDIIEVALAKEISRNNAYITSPPYTSKTPVASDSRKHIESRIQEFKSLNEEIKNLAPNPFPSYIVQFDRQSSAQLASRSIILDHGCKLCELELVEIDSRGILWQNLPISALMLRIRRLFAWLIAVFMVIGWTVPVALIGVLGQATYLGQLLRIQWLENHSIFVTNASTLIPPLLLGVVFRLVPQCFQWLARFSGCATEIEVQSTLQRGLFVFFYFQGFLLIALSEGAVIIFKTLLNNPHAALRLLGNNLACASTFFLNYLLVQGLNMAGAELLQIDGLRQLVWRRIIPRYHTPRRLFKLKTETLHIDMGEIYAKYTNMAVIAIALSVISPLILVCAGICFVANYFTFKYRFFFCYGR
jgi:hypothetical protein